MERSAVAYFTNGRIILAPVSRSVGGHALAGEPRWFGRSAKKAVIADAIVDALSRSTGGLPDLSSEQAKRYFIPFQDAANVKNFKTFMRDAKSVDIDVAGDVATLTPLENLGVRNGFEAVADGAMTVPAEDGAAIAGALLYLLGLRPGFTMETGDTAIAADGPAS